MEKSSIEFTGFKKIPRLFRDMIITEKIDGCLPFWTRISMANGDRIPISQVRAGDEVLGCRDGEVVATTVLRKFDNGPGVQWSFIKGTRERAGRGSAYAALNLTPSHQIWVPGSGYVRTDCLQSGNPFIVLRSELGLTPVQHSVLLGKLLGDGSLSRAESGSMSVAFGHRAIDAEYIDWTLRALTDVASSTVEEAVSGYGSPMLRSRSVFAPTITAEFGDFISPTGKVIPSWVAKDLDPLSLAFWYMDDGSLGDDGKQESRAHIATDGFTAADHDVLRSALGRLGIRADLQESRGRLALRLAADEAERLFLLVAPYVPPCMQRKLPERYRGGDGWLPDGSRSGYKTQLVEQEITEMDMDVKLRIPSHRHDIATETHNFFANGILVHNSNAAVGVTEDGEVYAQSRKRIITPETDNHGFAAWVQEHSAELATGLGEGLHFGEWWGLGINRGYGLTEKCFSLFNAARWSDDEMRPACCHVVPMLFTHSFDTAVVREVLDELKEHGSRAAPGYDKPEGIVVYHKAANEMFKVTIEDDQRGKDWGA